MAQDQKPHPGRLRLLLSNKPWHGQGNHASSRQEVVVVRPRSNQFVKVELVEDKPRRALPFHIGLRRSELERFKLISCVRSARNRRLEEARNALISEFDALGRDEIVARMGGKEIVDRWEREGLIFSVLHEGRVVYPSFQFDREGCPRPVIAQALAALGPETSPWGIALWLTAANGWLGGRRPVDLLDTAPDAVTDAVRHEASELVF